MAPVGKAKAGAAQDMMAKMKAAEAAAKEQEASDRKLAEQLA